MDDSPTLPDAAAPQRVGPYLVEREVGSGGMGSVYLARHEQTQQQVAVKVLPPALSRERGFVARFQREIESLKKLTNPHVVELYDSGVDGDYYYYAMEYVDGENLAELIRANDRLDWRETIEIAVQVCSALKAAHDAGVVHRDLKPSNLLIDSEGTVKLTDFGVAQVFAAGRLTRTGGVIGTVEYMSPEQARGGRVTRQSDLYSLGAVMYAMLTGRPPFVGKTTLEVVQKHQYGRFDRPKMYVSSIPVWLDDLVCQLLEKEPEKRPPDAFVLSRRLQEIVRKVDFSLQEETVFAERSGSSEPGPTVADAAAGEERHEPGIGTVMRDAVREQLIAVTRPGLWGRIFNNVWVLLALLVLLVLGGVWWWNARSLSPDEHFAAGEAIMQQPPGDDWLIAREEHFQPLLEQDPQTWRPRVEPYLERIAQYELEKEFLSRRKFPRTPRPESEPQRFLRMADELRRMGEFDRAERILTAVVALTADSEKQKAIHAIARRMLADVRAERGRLQARSTLLADSMQRAEQLLHDGKTAEAKTIWRSVIDLYGENASAGEEVARARRLLREHSKGRTNDEK